MRNIGPVTRRWLWEIGVRTLADLREHGAVATYVQVKRRQPRATKNLLWGLEAAIRDVDWRELTQNDKDALTAALPLENRP